MNLRPSMPGPAVSALPPSDRRISMEEIVAVVRQRRRERLRMRRELRDNGLLQDGLIDREQRAWGAAEQLLARCLVRREAIVGLVRDVAIDALDQETEEV